MEEEDIVFLFMLLQLLAGHLDDLLNRLNDLLTDHIKEQRRLNRNLPVDKVRVTWNFFCDRISIDHFRRMFRLRHSSFMRLCKRVCNSIGEEVFRPESYLLLHHRSSHELISGEVKVAICIRMLAGGSYLDLIPMFDVCKSSLYHIFADFLDWILSTFEFPLVGWLRKQQWEVLEFLANQFAERSNGVFYGPFGAVDGLAVRIKCPKEKEVPDPGNYYCRKGFYALNVQAICDKKKRFLWSFPSNKGSTHDSAAFSASRLFDLLKEVSAELSIRGLFIAGDSAYSLTPFLVVPYSVDEVKGDVNGSRDAFNFYLSSCRIQIECAFGELVMRWGIFWRTLLFDLKKSVKIIQVSMLLHNYIVDERDEDDTEDSRYFREFNVRMDEAQDELYNATREVPDALVTDNNEPRPKSRPTQEEANMRQQGEHVRTLLTTKLASANMRRPLQHNMRYNKHGNIVITS